ncbi:SMI1/KNR4 family protein [Actinomadura macrotermitis]|uniref:Knr4/Smi1-like domain-containing protein n=1 Tax=Actinomadura macrotermitis TaxID=2585200 RepID=A0A7K0C6Y6_9ACTN|nr:SMI1/KNR4 family protein [Actinomadura macrotermitis]MQY09220.1 hypothetical protein [Actinomadura macrotermitis]
MDWMPYLRRWSAERIDEHDPRQHQEPAPAAVQDRWLGAPPATEAGLEAAERRLGCALPPTYRAFLATTNGWRNLQGIVDSFRSADQIGWLHELEPHWAEGWAHQADEEDLDEDVAAHFGQIAALLRRGLLISLDADLTIIFLDPQDVDAGGDWAVYQYSSWSDLGPQRHAGLQDCFEDLHGWWVDRAREERARLDMVEATTERGRAAALAGDVDTALSLLSGIEQQGHGNRVEILLGQLRLFTGDRQEAERLLGYPFPQLFWQEEYNTDPLFIDELLPLMYLQYERAEAQGVMSTLKWALGAEHPGLQALVEQHRARSGSTAVVYGNPEFDAQVKAALKAHPEPSEELWQAIKQAFAAWRPRSHEHLAPVALFTHPVLATVITPERGRELLATPRPAS